MTVLFVIPDRFDFLSLSHKIVARYSCTVLQAKNHDEAKTAIQNETLDLIILNWHLPGVDTIELINEIRNNQGTQNTPLILKLVGVESEEKLQAYRSAGVNDFFPRPIRDNVLYEVLDSWLA